MRSMTSREADHERANYFLHTGNLPEETMVHPALGSVLAREGQGKNGVEAVNLIREHTPDLVFLDVQMPGLDGFGVIKKLLDKKTSLPQFVFATAFDQYAVKAFEVNAVDYLLKPVGRERFEAALSRAKERVTDSKLVPTELAASAREPQQFLERIVIRDGTRVTRSAARPVAGLPPARLVAAGADQLFVVVGGWRPAPLSRSPRRRSGRPTPPARTTEPRSWSRFAALGRASRSSKTSRSSSSFSR